MYQNSTAVCNSGRVNYSFFGVTNAMHELDTVERLYLTELNDHDENTETTDCILMSTRRAGRQMRLQLVVVHCIVLD
jgi:hypothetical protein